MTRRRRLDRLTYAVTAAAVAVIGVASLVAGIYPAAWADTTSSSLTLAGAAVLMFGGALLGRRPTR